MKSLCLVAVLAALGVAQCASADNTPLKPYSLRLVLPSDSVDCGARASSLGDVFAAQTGLTVTSAVCQGTHSIIEGANTFTTTTLVIDYMADAEVVPAQAIFGGSEFLGTPSDSSGLFAKYSDCLNARGAQEAAYAAATGLQVFATYCEIADDVVNPGYVLVVEAFGTPKAHLYAFTQDASMGAVSPLVMAAAQAAITQAGGTVVLSDATHVFYYSSNGLEVDVRDLGFFSDVSQCQAQTAAANSIFSRGNAEGISALCVTTPGSANVAATATLTVVASNTLGISDDYGYGSQKYSSFTDCMGDLSRVLQNAESNSPSILGGICEPSDSDSGLFVAHVFSAMN